MKKIKIISIDEVDDYECECGNTSYESGFFPCDKNGNEIEPTVESDWDGLYVCAGCGRIHKVD